MNYKVTPTENYNLEIEQKLLRMLQILIVRNMWHEAVFLCFLRDTGYRPEEIAGIRMSHIDSSGVLTGVPSAKPGETFCNPRQLNKDLLDALDKITLPYDQCLFPNPRKILSRIKLVTEEPIRVADIRRYAQQRLCDTYIPH